MFITVKISDSNKSANTELFTGENIQIVWLVFPLAFICIFNSKYIALFYMVLDIECVHSIKICIFKSFHHHHHTCLKVKECLHCLLEGVLRNILIFVHQHGVTLDCWKVWDFFQTFIYYKKKIRSQKDFSAEHWSRNQPIRKRNDTSCKY